MLTWAVCWLHVKMAPRHNGLWVVAAIIGDVLIMSDIALAVSKLR
jgi:hypothetical protein